MKAAIVGSLLLLVFPGCGGEASETGFHIEESGSIDEGDSTDPNYGGYAYDQWEFQAERFDRVTVSIESEGFQPLLTLHESATGAHLAEWDSNYSDEPALVYRIAAVGSYQARVSSMSGTGRYTVRITVEGN